MVTATMLSKPQLFFTWIIGIACIGPCILYVSCVSIHAFYMYHMYTYIYLHVSYIKKSLNILVDSPGYLQLIWVIKS